MRSVKEYKLQIIAFSSTSQSKLGKLWIPIDPYYHPQDPPHLQRPTHPQSELRNVNTFTRSKTVEPNFTRHFPTLPTVVSWSPVRAVKPQVRPECLLLILDVSLMWLLCYSYVLYDTFFFCLYAIVPTRSMSPDEAEVGEIYSSGFILPSMVLSLIASLFLQRG